MMVALLALFFALGGGAYAASKLAANSVGTKQLKKNAVTNAKIGGNAVTGGKVKNGSLTGADINLATLPKVGSASSADNAGHATAADNATHATNADKATNADNATHATNADNATHATNADKATNADQLGGVGASSYVTPTSTLPSGATETGGFTASGFNGGYAIDSVNFVPHLNGTPNIEYRPTGTTSTNCPGEGRAGAGWFCVYETWIFQMTFNFNAPLQVDGKTLGWELEWASTNNSGNTRGTWAYTAPSPNAHS